MKTIIMPMMPNRSALTMQHDTGDLLSSSRAPFTAITMENYKNVPCPYEKGRYFMWLNFVQSGGVIHNGWLLLLSTRLS